MEKRNNRFKQHLYALCSYFRKRGCEVNTREKTIIVDAYDLYGKEQERLRKLQAYGFRVINPNEDHSFQGTGYCCSESFLDFADEIMAMYGSPNINY